MVSFYCNFPFPGPGCNPCLWLHLVVIYPGLFNLEQFLSLCLLWYQSFWKILARVGVVWCFFMRRFRLCLFGRHTLPKWWCILVTASHHEVTDVNCNQLVKIVSARFLHLKVTIFPFVIIKYFGGRYFETMQISFCSSKFHPLVLASTVVLDWINYYSEAKWWLF